MSTKAKKPIIAIDIDEVLQPLHIKFLYYHNDKHGTSFIYPDTKGRYWLEEFTGEPSESVEQKLQEFIRSDEFKAIKPLPGAVKAIRQLKRTGYELAVITSRQSFWVDVTREFLEKHFAEAFSGVHFITHYVGSALRPAAPKLEICQRIGAAYLIDDNSDTCASIAKGGLRAILFGDYHWNKRERLPAGVTRCKNWPEVLEYFDGKS